ncbi:MAG: DoxX family protein [Halioglobus sp.]
MISTIRNAWRRIEQWLDYLAPVVDLAVRLYVAKIFFLSGLNKFQDWETTLYLFQEEYHVPLLSPQVAAALGTAGELGFSVLLALGLLTRFSACGLFVLNIVALVSYYDALQDSPAALQDHLEWGLLLAILLSSKVRALSLDYWVAPRPRALPAN